MKNNLSRTLLVLAILLSGCSTAAGGPEQTRIPQPTPTTNQLFAEEQESGLQIVDLGSSTPGAVPTVSGLFQQKDGEQPPRAVKTQPPATVVQASGVEPASTLVSEPIFANELSPNWIIRRPQGMLVDLSESTVVHSEPYAVEVLPAQGLSPLYFTVRRDSSRQYAREHVVGISFWLSGGDALIEPDDLAVTVVGSNLTPYWEAGDTSVTSRYTPVFSESRLYYLGVEQSIPVGEWAQVVLWLNDRAYDPDYSYVTGFYIKNDVDFTGPIYIDDIEIIVQPDPNATPEPDVEQAPDDPLVAAPGSTELTPLWIVQVDVQRDRHAISPLIYGVSDSSPDYLVELQPGLVSWGGNTSTRYNWVHGHAWNAGRDYFFRNGNYGVTSGSASDNFIVNANQAGAEVRLAVPTLGWVAANDDLNTCSFPLPNGTCGDAGGARCDNPTVVADPNLANIPSTVNSIKEWITHLIQTRQYDLRFIAMDNEPELWGYTHYDVHPTCTTYTEILDSYLQYASALREVAPDAEFTGPVTCCWTYYWNSAAGTADKLLHGNQPFIPWFLEQVRKHDEKNKIRTLDVLDIHYYPEDVYNSNVDEKTAGLRLRSTRTLWDRNYVAESWINEPIYLIPRMKEIISKYYPGLKLGISEWNWGADETMNGALAIADVLGIFGREDLYMASYWINPPLDSPGFFAFKMFTNFDGEGGRFADTSVWAQSNDYDSVSSYAAIDSQTGNLHLMLINKLQDTQIPVQVELNGFKPSGSVTSYQYTQGQPKDIVSSTLEVPSGVFETRLPGYSITLLVFEPEK